MEKRYFCQKCNTEFLITDDLFDIPLQCSKCSNIFTVSRVQTTGKGNQTVNTPKTSFQKVNIFCKRYKRLVISCSLLVFAAVIFLLVLPLIIHGNIRIMPKILQQYGTVVGSSVQRARACWILGCQEKNEKKSVYFEKGLRILENCEENGEVLNLKLHCKYHTSDKVFTSPEAERLIQLDNGYIYPYIFFRQDARRNNNVYPEATPEELALLKKYELYLLEKIKTDGLKYPVAGNLGCLYSGDLGNTADYEKAEYYLKEAVKDKNGAYWNINLIKIYARQNKIEEAEELAKKFIKTKTYADNRLKWNEIVAWTLFDIHTSSLHFRGQKLNLPLNYEKAIEWKEIVLKYNPALELSLDFTLKKQFPEKYQK